MSDTTNVMAPNNVHPAQAFPLQFNASNINPSKEDGEFLPFGKDGLTFFDLIDVINPLQHIPIVSSIYRNLTGDTVDPASKIAGGALFGGPFGAASSLVSVIMKEATGKGISDHILAFFTGEDGEETETKIANQEETNNSQFQNASAQFTNYTEVLEWAQKEAKAGFGFSPIQNADASTSSTDYIEVSQWAQHIANNEPSFNESPIITGAELALLRAEAGNESTNIKTAALPINPSAPPTNIKYSTNENNVSRWAQKELEIANANSRPEKQDSWIKEIRHTANETYWKGIKLATTGEGFNINQQH